MLTLAAFCGRMVHGLLRLLLAGGVLALALLLVLAWRLSQGPLDVDWAARRIEAAANADAAAAPPADAGPDAAAPGTAGQSRLSIGRAALRWGGFAAGPGQGLQLLLEAVRVVDQAGQPVAKVDSADLSVSFGRLLMGEVVPRALAVRGLDVRLVRDAAGDVRLDLATLDLPDDKGDAGPTVAETLAELARPVRHDGSRPVRPDLRHIEQLESVRIDDAVLRLHVAGLRGVVRMDLEQLDLRRRPGGGVVGAAHAGLALGSARATIALQADLAPAGGTVLRLELAPTNARVAQEAAPEIAGPDSLDAAVQGVAGLELDAALHPTRATLRLEAGTGQLRLAGAAIGFDSVSLEGGATWDPPRWAMPQRVDLVRSKAVLHAPGGSWPTTLTVAGGLALTPGRIAGTVEAGLDHLAFADIGALWPARLGGHLRPWMVPNLTGGTARDGAIKLSFEAPSDLSDVVVTAIDGRVRGEDVTVWWVQPVPPVEGAQAQLTIKDPKFLEIVIPTARQGPLALRDGLIRITGLQDKDQYMALGATVQGAVPDVLALLRHPRLQLLSRKPIPMRNPAGAMVGRMNVDMMLKDHLEFEDVHIQATTRLTGLRLGGLVAGRDLDRGDIQLDASSDSLRAAGAATVGGIPSDILVEMDFKPGGPAQVVQRAQATGRATGPQLAAAGLDAGGIIAGGAGQFTARYQQRRDNSADVQVTADLRDAALALAGWKKPPGQPAEASATLTIRGDKLLGIDALRAQGSGMELAGRAEMVGNRPLSLVMDRIVLGATQGRGQVRLPAGPNEPIRATLSGTVLDLSDALARKPDPAAAVDTPWVADIAFDRVLFAKERGLTGVTAHAEHDGRRLATLAARTTGPERVEATIQPQAGGRRLVLKAADGGGLLRGADLLDTVQGGQLTLDASYDDTKPGSPLTGTARMAGFNVRNAAALGKLLQAVTIYGVVDALSGPGLSFSRLEMPFRWDGTALDVNDAQAFSASLGLTARGRVDTDRKTIAIQGTVVPLYVFNSLLGRIPLVGRLFTSEQGGGLLAMNYSVRGPTADPTVLVNPLSALTPGFLRGLFHILD